MTKVELPRKVLFNVFERIVASGYRFEVENQENLAVLRERPADPALLYFNHTRADDPLCAYYLLHRNAKGRLKNLIVPVSEEYVHFKNFREYAIAAFLAREVARINTLEVKQSYRMRSEEGDNNNSDAEELKSYKLIKQFKNVLKEQFSHQEIPRPCVLLSPEGHRSENRTLLPAEAGAGYIANIIADLKKEGKIDNGYFIPFGIVFEEENDKFLYWSPLKRSNVKLVVGAPLEIDRVISSSQSLIEKERPRSRDISHYLMVELSYLLPPSMRGVYHPKLLNQTLAGRFEQRTKKDGNVAIYDKQEKRFLDISDITRT